jgi:hypothetical protein
VAAENPNYRAVQDAPKTPNLLSTNPKVRGAGPARKPVVGESMDGPRIPCSRTAGITCTQSVSGASSCRATRISCRDDAGTPFPAAIFGDGPKAKGRELEVKILALALGHGRRMPLRARTMSTISRWEVHTENVETVCGIRMAAIARVVAGWSRTSSSTGARQRE